MHVVLVYYKLPSWIIINRFYYSVFPKHEWYTDHLQDSTVELNQPTKSYIFVINFHFFLQLKCVTYDHDGRCCGGLLYTFLTHNREKSEKFCNDIIDGLIKKDLEPLLQNINHTSSYEVIHSVIKGIENKYWSRAIGPAAGDVYKMFHTVRSGRIRFLVRSRFKMLFLIFFRLHCSILIVEVKCWDFFFLTRLYMLLNHVRKFAAKY